MILTYYCFELWRKRKCEEGGTQGGRRKRERGIGGRKRNLS
jgi:hypothetical protein